MKNTAKIIKMTSSPTIKASSCGQGCRVYVMPLYEKRPWDGNRTNTKQAA